MMKRVARRSRRSRPGAGHHQGLRESHMPQIAAWMDEAIRAAAKDDEPVIQRIAGDVRELLATFPVPGFAPGN